MQSISRSFDLSVRNRDRSFNLTLNLTILGSAFLTIVVPLIKDDISIPLAFAVLFFFLSIVLGIIFIFCTIKRDQRLIDEDAKWEYDILQEHLKRCNFIRSSLYEYKKSPSPDCWKGIDMELKKYFTQSERLHNESELRQAQKEQEFSSKILRFLECIFFLTIAVALLSLFIWLFSTKIISPFMNITALLSSLPATKIFNVTSILFELIGTLTLAIGASAFFSNKVIANQAILRVPMSTTNGPPSQDDLLNSFRGKELIGARRYARIGTIMIVFGLVLELTMALFKN